MAEEAEDFTVELRFDVVCTREELERIQSEAVIGVLDGCNKAFEVRVTAVFDKEWNEVDE